jgi:hypothetical protein
LIIDECIDYCCNYILNKNGSSKEKVINLILDLKDQNTKVNILRCENAGKNKSLEDECKSKGLGIAFEYAGPRTLNRNGKMERITQILYGLIRAMFNESLLQEEIRSGIWEECASVASFYSNILAARVTKRSPHELLFGFLESAIRALEKSTVNLISRMRIRMRMPTKSLKKSRKSLMPKIMYEMKKI